MTGSVGGGRLRAEVLEYLASLTTMTVATCGGGIPWAADVFYVNRDFVFYYLSDPRAKHSVDIASNPSVAVTIHLEQRDWREIKGVQMEGMAELLPEGRELEDAWDLYLAKYPFVKKWQLDIAGKPLVAKALKALGGDLGETARRVGSVRLYRVTATRVLYIDNSKGFAHRDEVMIGE